MMNRRPSWTATRNWSRRVNKQHNQWDEFKITGWIDGSGDYRESEGLDIWS